MMKQPLIQSAEEIKYKFNRLTPEGIDIKNSCSFSYNNENYMICDNQTTFGLITYKEVNGEFVEIQRMFEGWVYVWAPCIIEYEGRLIVFFSDTAGLNPYWQTQRIRYIDNYIPGIDPGNYQTLNLGHDKGVIDPEIIRIGNKWYIFYTIMDWNCSKEGSWQWWDIYYSVADHPSGPYSEMHNVSQVVEHGIEEASFYNKYDNYFYYSVKDSVNDSHIRRGKLIMQNGIINIEPDNNTIISAVDSITCTHPDAWNGKLRATLLDKPLGEGGQCYIAELN